MKKTILTFFILLAVMLTTTTYAVALNSLYTAEIPVTSRNIDQQKTALSLALKNIFIKVSGNIDIVKIDEINDAIKKPNQYIRDFSYIQVPSDATTPLTLQVNFAPQSINNLLKQTGQPIWKKNRPLTLVWLATQDVSGTQLNNNDDNPIVKNLTDDAKQRGLPLIFPILDLTDLQQIQPSDVWAPFINVIQNASSRYAPNEILIIRIDQSAPNNIISHWSLLLKDDQLSWDIKGNDVKTIVQDGINNITNILAKRFAVTENNQPENTINFMVINLTNINDYAKTVRYLNNLAGVTNVEVQNVNASQANFHLTLNTNIDTLQRTIQLNSVLSPTQSDVPPSDQPTILTYKYNHTE
ncbi:MAG: DUF2066 domain-containing protein [Gammaproteobacteria bacterium]|jgi:hypothetical protein